MSFYLSIYINVVICLRLLGINGELYKYLTNLGCHSLQQSTEQYFGEAVFLALVATFLFILVDTEVSIVSKVPASIWGPQEPLP